MPPGGPWWRKMLNACMVEFQHDGHWPNYCSFSEVAQDDLRSIDFRPWKSSEVYMQCGDNQRPCAVGIRNICTSQVIMRVFYPADADSIPADTKVASWFRTSLYSLLEGYLHTFVGAFFSFARHGSAFFVFLKLIARFVSFLLPMRFATLPNCYENLKTRCQDAGRLPIILWSHGLTGNGDEHGLLAAALAADGNIVALLHHRDGSSAKVNLSWRALSRF